MVVTFLPFADFAQSAASLDDQRLGKQRVEAFQILSILTNISFVRGFAHHPMTEAWRGYEMALAEYLNCCIVEWVRRGKRNTMNMAEITKPIRYPWWLGWEAFHYSHQAMLKRKKPGFYTFVYPIEYDNYGYIWPASWNVLDKRKSLAVLASPIPLDLVSPRYCSVLLKSGKRKGQPCDNLLRKTQQTCNVHK